MPFYSDSDGAGVRVPTLGAQDAPLYQGGFMCFGMAVVAAGDDTGNSSATYGPVPDSAPSAASDTDADILVDTAEAFDIFNIEATAANRIWVPKLAISTITAFTASVTIDIGDTDLADGWMRTEALLPTTTDLGYTASDSAIQADPGIYMENGGRGRVYAASSAHIGATIAAANPAVGRLALFVQYARVHRADAS